MRQSEMRERVRERVRVVFNHSLGETPSGWKSGNRAETVRGLFRRPKDALPSEWLKTTRTRPRPARLLLALLLALVPVALHAQALDREAIYQKALPLYDYDAKQPLAVHLGESRPLEGVRLLRFSYLSAHSQRVPALLFTPRRASAARPVPCLVLLHGLGGSKEVMAGLALAAAQAGYASLAIDEYGQGERAASTHLPKTQAEQLATGVRQTVVDVRRSLDYLATRPEINSQRIGLAGISLGAIIGTVTAGVEPRIKATALISGGGDWGLILKTLSANRADVGGRSTAGIKGLDYGQVSAFLAPEDPLTFAPHVSPRALLMLHGRKDEVIVPQAAQELFDAAREPKEILWFAPYGHVPPPEVVEPALRAFFGKRL